MSLAFDMDYDGRHRHGAPSVPKWPERAVAHPGRSATLDVVAHRDDHGLRTFYTDYADISSSFAAPTAINDIELNYALQFTSLFEGVNDVVLAYTETLERAITDAAHRARGYVRPAAPSRYFDSVTGQLERLQDGWAGPETLAPSPSTIKDIARASTALQDVTLAPEVDVDEDGTVTCAWQQGGQRFALTFSGRGTVVGTLSPWTSDYPPWKLGVSEEADLASKLEFEAVAKLIGAR